MSSLAFSASWGGAVVFAVKKEPALVLQRLAALPKLAGVTAASQLEVRPTPEMVSSGIREIDGLAGGLPRGCLSEICGPASSGRTSVLLSALAAATRRQEVCALVDATDALDTVSAAAAGVELERLLWIRCTRASGGGRWTSDFGPRTSDLKAPTSLPMSDGRGLRSDARGPTSEVRRPTDARLEQALRVTDLLLQSGGFGLVAIDLGDVPDSAARRIPLASWFRFQRAVEPTATVLLVVAQAPCAQTCASLLIRLQAGGKSSALSYQLSTEEKFGPAHAQLLEGLQVEGELLRSLQKRCGLRRLLRGRDALATAGGTPALRIER
jgi:hypothetical protein